MTIIFNVSSVIILKKSNMGVSIMFELYKNLGFEANPFSRFSAEEEIDYLKDIYSPPKYYQTISSDIRDGSSRFIFGERGIGKSALMFKLMQEFEKGDVFTVLIDQYDNIPIKNNDTDLLLEILKKVVTSFSITILKNKHIMKKLNKQDKEKLSFFILLFFESLSQSEFNSLYDKANKYKSRNMLKHFFNALFSKPLNITISGASEYISSTVSKSLGLNANFNSDFYKAYIPELKIEKIEKPNINISKLDYKRLKELLEDFTLLIKKCEFKNTVIFFDKIDEYPKLNGNIKSITEFVKELTVDTNLLHMKHVAFVFVIWSKVKKEMNDTGTRYDKFKPLDITWSEAELKSIIEKRLCYFSKNKISLSDIVQKDENIRQVLEIANKSPRHLIMLLSRIYDEQAIIDSNSNNFSDEAIKQGVLNFIMNFDYHSLYPGKTGRKDYIVTVLNKMLRVKKINFEIKDWVAEFKVSTQSASKDIQILKEYALIVEVDNTGSARKKYKVIEPRIRHLITNGVSKLGDESDSDINAPLADAE